MAWLSEITIAPRGVGAIRVYAIEWASVWRGPGRQTSGCHRSGRVSGLVFATFAEAVDAQEVVADLLSPQRGALDPREEREIVTRVQAALAERSPVRARA